MSLTLEWLGLVLVGLVNCWVGWNNLTTSKQLFKREKKLIDIEFRFSIKLMAVEAAADAFIKEHHAVDNETAKKKILQ